MGIIKKNNNQAEIDLIALFKLMLSKAWIILAIGIVFGAGAVGFTYVFVEPMYTASINMYVNNTNNFSDKFSITSSDISASIMLIQTYTTIIKSETILDSIIDMSGVSYTAEELYEMIDAGSVENTEVLVVSVTDSDPKEAALIANSIAEIVPRQLSEIVAGSSVKVLNSAKVPDRRSSPSYSKMGLLGIVVGMFLSAFIIVLVAILKSGVQSGDDFENWDYPVLGRVPELVRSPARTVKSK